jgi:hypothetical protein
VVALKFVSYRDWIQVKNRFRGLVEAILRDIHCGADRLDGVLMPRNSDA